jgi:hypothetical protein
VKTWGCCSEAAAAVHECDAGGACSDLHGVMESSLGQTNSLKSDANAPFVQQPDGDLVTVAHTAKHGVSIHHAVGERNLASAAGPYAEFVLIAPHVQARIAGFNDEGCDALVPDERRVTSMRNSLTRVKLLSWTPTSVQELHSQRQGKILPLSRRLSSTCCRR